MEKVRGFEIAKGFEDKNINLPERKTKYSAAYDKQISEVIPAEGLGKYMIITPDSVDIIKIG